MTLTLLLDLDDTLLDTNIEQFIPAYFEALSKHLASRVKPEIMLAALASGTRGMMAALDPAQTLRQVFDAKFNPKLGIEHGALAELIEQFYDDVFPELGALMKPRPEAIKLVDWAFAQGYRVAIATDPLFPLKAIHHRLRFAGLPPEKYPFALISSYETFHFTKTHAAYFAEFMGQLGWPDGPVLMVGNDADRDLAPARVLGLPTFWITTDSPQPSDPAADGRGGLADLRPWLESVDLTTLEPHFTTPESFRALLTAAPASIARFLEQIPVSSWTRRPADGEWSLTEVLCHLRDTETEVNAPRFQRLLTEQDPFIPASNTNAWVSERKYNQQDGLPAYRDYLAARLLLLAGLEKLTDTDWSRKARHSTFGPTTLLETVGFMAEHDRLHIQQIAKFAGFGR